MRAGKLRHLISIETPTSTKGKFSDKVVTWELFRKVWANIETLKGNERATASASWPTSDVKITLRYIAGVLPTMRVVYEGSIYSILNVNDVELNHQEIILTTETGMKGS